MSSAQVRQELVAVVEKYSTKFEPPADLGGWPAGGLDIISSPRARSLQGATVQTVVAVARGCALTWSRLSCCAVLEDITESDATKSVEWPNWLYYRAQEGTNGWRSLLEVRC